MLAQLNGRRHAADLSLPRDGRENRFDFRQIFENLQSHRPLAGDDLQVVVLEARLRIHAVCG